MNKINKRAVGFITRLHVISGLSLLVLYSAQRGFCPGTVVFPSPEKPAFDLIGVNNYYFQLNWSMKSYSVSMLPIKPLLLLSLLLLLLLK